MKRILNSIFIILTIGLLGCDDDEHKGALTSTDTNFAEQAALSNLAEIDLATVASTRATNALVKDFAQHMIAEHNQAQSELKDIADDYSNVDWPTSPDAAHVQIKQQLSGLSGIAFDTTYMSSQVKDHSSVIVLFQLERTNGTDRKLKQYADKYLPHIEEHYATSLQLLNEVKVESND